jgi:hypothetical protein
MPSWSWLFAGRCLVAFVVMGLGCRPPAPAQIRPPGAGWSCPRDRLLETWSMCERLPADCETTAEAVRADAKAEGSPADIPSCHPQPRAVCYTFHARKPGNDNFMCYETTKDCDAGQKRRLSEPDEYSNVSRCDEWD